MTEPMEPFEIWLLHRLALAVEAGEVPQEEGEAAATRQILAAANHTRGRSLERPRSHLVATRPDLGTALATVRRGVAGGAGWPDLS